ncbi:MAG: hypothetical protein ACUVQI_06760 [Thermochromatium sp.]
MTKLIQTAFAIALTAAKTTAFAWQVAPYQPVVPTPEQHRALVEQQQAMLEQHDKALRAAFEAQRRFVEQQLTWAEQNQASWSAFPKPPAAPEFPKGPEFGQPPALPESIEAHLKEMDAYREQAKKQIEERREAIRQWSEARRAQSLTRHLGESQGHTLPERPLAMRPLHQAQAPAETTTQTP